MPSAAARVGSRGEATAGPKAALASASTLDRPASLRDSSNSDQVSIAADVSCPASRKVLIS